MKAKGASETLISRGRAFRLMLLGMAGGVLCLALFCLQYYCLARPMGEGAAGPSVPAESFRSVWSSREVVLLGLGDSVTAGFGAAPDKSYVARLADNPPDELSDMQGICLRAVLPNLRVVNVSVSGSNSIEHSEKQLPELLPFPESVFGIVVITTGGNDIIHWYGARPPAEGAMYGATFEQAQPWIAAFEQRLNSMCERLVDLFPGGCRIFLANIYDPSDGGGDPRWVGLPAWRDLWKIHAAYNEVIGRCAAQHEAVAMVDLHSAFLGHGIRCRQFWHATYRPEDPHYWYYENIEDPNERGYDAIRRLFLLRIVEELGVPGSALRGNGASDVHLTVGSPPAVRVQGGLPKLRWSIARDW